MTGTLVNAAAVVAGALIGLLLKKGIPERVRAALMRAEGLAIVVIGLGGALGEMFSVNPASGRLESGGGLLLLLSLVAGCLAGELLRLDDRLDAAGRRLERRFGADGFARGMIAASVIFCTGAMAIIGPVNEGLTGDRSVLYIKSLLDGTTSVVLASVMGPGVLLAALPVLVLQGVPALLAAQLSPYMTPQLLSPFCLVGYALVAAIGCNFLVGAKIRIANLLPALAVPVAQHFIASL